MNLIFGIQACITTLLVMPSSIPLMEAICFISVLELVVLVLLLKETTLEDATLQILAVSSICHLM